MRCWGELKSLYWLYQCVLVMCVVNRIINWTSIFQDMWKWNSNLQSARPTTSRKAGSALIITVSRRFLPPVVVRGMGTASSPVARDHWGKIELVTRESGNEGSDAFYARSHLPSLALLACLACSLACLACSRVPQSLLRLGKYKAPYETIRQRRQRRQRQRQKAIGLVSKTTTLHVHHAFVCISLPSLHDYDVKWPNFKFFLARERQGDKFYHLCLNSAWPPLLSFNINSLLFINWATWDNREMVWKDVEAIFQRRFHGRRRCWIVRSL